MKVKNVNIWKRSELRCLIKNILLFGDNWIKISLETGTRTEIKYKKHAKRFFIKNSLHFMKIYDSAQITIDDFFEYKNNLLTLNFASIKLKYKEFSENSMNEIKINFYKNLKSLEIEKFYFEKNYIQENFPDIFKEVENNKNSIDKNIWLKLSVDSNKSEKFDENNHLNNSKSYRKMNNSNYSDISKNLNLKNYNLDNSNDRNENNFHSKKRLNFIKKQKINLQNSENEENEENEENSQESICLKLNKNDSPRKSYNKDYRLISMKIVKRFNTRNFLRNKYFLIRKFHGLNRCKHKMKNIKILRRNRKILRKKNLLRNYNNYQNIFDLNKNKTFNFLERKNIQKNVEYNLNNNFEENSQNKINLKRENLKEIKIPGLLKLSRKHSAIFKLNKISKRKISNTNSNKELISNFNFKKKLSDEILNNNINKDKNIFLKKEKDLLSISKTFLNGTELPLTNFPLFIHKKRQRLSIYSTKGEICENKFNELEVDFNFDIKNEDFNYFENLKNTKISNEEINSFSESNSSIVLDDNYGKIFEVKKIEKEFKNQLVENLKFNLRTELRNNLNDIHFNKSFKNYNENNNNYENMKILKTENLSKKDLNETLSSNHSSLEENNIDNYKENLVIENIEYENNSNEFKLKNLKFVTEKNSSKNDNVKNINISVEKITELNKLNNLYSKNYDILNKIEFNNFNSLQNDSVLIEKLFDFSDKNVEYKNLKNVNQNLSEVKKISVENLNKHNLEKIFKNEAKFYDDFNENYNDILKKSLSFSRQNSIQKDFKNLENKQKINFHENYYFSKNLKSDSTKKLQEENLIFFIEKIDKNEEFDEYFNNEDYDSESSYDGLNYNSPTKKALVTLRKLNKFKLSSAVNENNEKINEKFQNLILLENDNSITKKNNYKISIENYKKLDSQNELLISKENINKIPNEEKDFKKLKNEFIFSREKIRKNSEYNLLRKDSLILPPIVSRKNSFVITKELKRKNSITEDQFKEISVNNSDLFLAPSTTPINLFVYFY